MLALVLSVAALFAQPDTTFQPAAPADTGGTEVEEVIAEVVAEVRSARVQPLFSPSSLYSPSKGFGIAGGVAVDGLLSADDHAELGVRLSQRLQGVYGEYLTGDPRRHRLFWLVGGAAGTTSRSRFVGHGPSSPVGAELFLDRYAVEAEGRLGWSPGRLGRVLLEPVVRFRADRLRGYEEVDPGDLAAVAPSDLARLDALRGENRVGAEAGLIAVLDTRDLPTMPSRGLYAQGEVVRFQAFDGSGLAFTRVQALGYVFRPAPIRLPFLPERGALFVRVNGVVTREEGGAPLPWVYLPSLDGDLLVGYPRRDFVGRDAFSVTVGARAVIAQLIGAFLVEGVAEGMAGAAYDDVFRQFTPRVRFAQGRVAEGGGVPLRPSAAVGLNLRFIDRERPVMSALVGVGPGGVSFASLRLVYGLTDYRPRIR